MKITYALIAACLALQGCNNEAPTTSIRANDNSLANQYNAVVPLRDAQYTTVVTTPMITSFDDYSFVASAAAHLTDDEYVATTSAISAIKPIAGEEFEGASRVDAASVWGTLPTSLEIDDYVINSSMDTEDHTATVTSPAGTSLSADNGADNTASVTVDFYVSDERSDLDRTGTIDQQAIRATDWW